MINLGLEISVANLSQDARDGILRIFCGLVDEKGMEDIFKAVGVVNYHGACSHASHSSIRLLIIRKLIFLLIRILIHCCLCVWVGLVLTHRTCIIIIVLIVCIIRLRISLRLVLRFLLMMILPFLLRIFFVVFFVFVVCFFVERFSYSSSASSSYSCAYSSSLVSSYYA